MDSPARVTHQWERITSWLKRHAPATYARLRPPVTPEALEWYEQRIGTPVHADLKALWGVNEGAYLFTFPDFLDGYAPLSIDGSVRCHPLENGEERGWERSWIPFVCNDPTDPYSGMFHDTKTGFVGHWAEAEMPTVSMGTTLADYLKSEADALHKAPDQSTGGDVPGISDGSLVWDDPARRLYEELDDWRPFHRRHRNQDQGDA
ncbi:SMI1/KNR4 family protein [Streptomyces sp. N2-109]|uniref:SMI1/KNR4 family protein n=1 Tax=Streptomyces gossypii TaxID=2883101 RepID=A0ABT2JMR0_9ACTN|nr:SMI1/KNR4 family protein [Streptomyces gossypii]MCT2588799.1 SMI1/KNR4 family protein [Streptomyces gossypii]